ncbi:MAG: von Willebrand factor type A domain-containing protein, partial [Deltaproteobacteria bacterium]|nr:von Willebrand factor type A domain-containing protein [Deltaproteobacteria bacterium]
MGLGNTGLIGKGGGGGNRSGYGRGSGAGFGGRGKLRGKGGTRALPRGPVVEPGFIAVADDAKSTFSIDVDTASYSATRRTLQLSQLPAPDSVRLEELVNYFDYDYVPPQGDTPFSVTAEVGECPWNPDHELVHLGLQGKMVAAEDVPPRNLVFLVDTSGSMSSPDTLPLV